ncbi:MAG TPA: protein phosphatase 2C domain-containing protein [Acidimicrobiales bacterium]|nr:protein phosphatase 2C domain-containing protein [Acidimicrobiales bacterium]
MPDDSGRLDMTDSAVAGTCAQCGAVVGFGDQFCESCGATLLSAPGGPAAGSRAAEPPVDLDGPRTHIFVPGKAAQEPLAGDPVPHCRECGAEVAGDGYCTQCGARAPVERDHWVEQPAAWVAAVCDRGLKHYRNEDGVATAADPEPGSFCALVVCDGVTTSTDSDLASLAAARAGRDVLGAAPHGPAEGDDPGSFWSDRMREAAKAANEQARQAAVQVGDADNPPACTFVAAVSQGPVIVAGCVGDSRAYWLPDEGVPLQLSTDDSWVTEQVARGVNRAVAEADVQAHSITRWLGVDSPDTRPSCATTTTGGLAGWLLVCSDGLWNYCSPAADLRARIDELVAEHGADPALLAGGLIDWANAQGGHDNVTAALARLPGAGPGAVASSAPAPSEA